MRTEKEIFADLAELCISPGYVHALAFISFKDNMVAYLGEMTTQDLQKMFSKDRLIRTEVSTLIGLLLKKEVDYSLPSLEVVQNYLDRTYALLEELHGSMMSVFRSILEQVFDKNDLEQLRVAADDLLARGEAMREPIFYGGEGAFSFQYRDFAVKKYARDDAWLGINKGFSVHNARDVVHAVGKLQDERLAALVYSFTSTPPEKWTFLPGFSFTAPDIGSFSGIDLSVVENVLGAFTVADGERNEGFRTLHDFNVANATPLLRNGDNFILFQQYSLVESLYESPFYWMACDHKYAPTSLKQSGVFTEEFAKERLDTVFGQTRVHRNVHISKSKDKRLGEIDVLVVFGDRAIVVQAKAKRLTLEARKGNDGQIREDFKKSVQDAYDQGHKCAQLLNDAECTFIDDNGQEILVSHKLKEIYIFCLVTDHYPALSFQVRHCLRVHNVGDFRPPIVVWVLTPYAVQARLPAPPQVLISLYNTPAYGDTR